LLDWNGLAKRLYSLVVILKDSVAKGQIPLGELVGKLVDNPGCQLVRVCTEQVGN